MKLYRIQFKALTPYVGNLAGNTFFGAFCCAYKDIYGEDKLVGLLKQLKDNKAELTFSDSFKTGYVPLEINKGDNKLIRLDTVGTEAEDIISSIQDNEVGVHAKIGNDNNELFEVRRTILEGVSDVYLASTLDLEVIKTCFEVAFRKGLGARKSTGNGILDIVDINEYQFDVVNKTGFLVLSNVIPNNELTLDISFRPVIRNGINIEGKKQKSLLMFKTGSVFKSICKTLTCGTVIYDKGSNSYINGKAICFPIEV